MNYLITIIILAISLQVKAADSKRLNEWENKVKNSSFSGTVLSAYKGKMLYQRSFGMANRETQTPFKENTVFDIGSITKQFTATAILKLIEQRKLSLQMPLNQFFSSIPDDKKDITLHQLLTHTAGFPHGFGLYNKVKREEFIQRAFGAELLDEPGKHYHYSNVGYGLLAVVIELVAKTSWESYIRQHILLPAGIKDTGYRKINPAPQSLAINYGRDPNAFQRFFSLNAKSRSVGHSLQHQIDDPGPRWFMEGAGGFLSSVEDMFRWYSLLRSGELLAGNSWQHIFTPHIAENREETSFYGYGWAIDNDSLGNRRISHDGSNGYSYAVFKYFPELDFFIFVATNNRDDYPEKLINSFDEITIETVTGNIVY